MIRAFTLKDQQRVNEVQKEEGVKRENREELQEQVKIVVEGRLDPKDNIIIIHRILSNNFFLYSFVLLFVFVSNLVHFPQIKKSLKN